MYVIALTTGEEIAFGSVCLSQNVRTVCGFFVFVFLFLHTNEMVMVVIYI